MNCVAATRLHAARAWLAHTLASGPVPVTDLQAAAAAAGHAWRTVERARLVLGVTAAKAAMRSGWAWALPLTPKGATGEAEAAQRACAQAAPPKQRSVPVPTGDDEGAQAARRQVAQAADAEGRQGPDELAARPAAAPAGGEHSAPHSAPHNSHTAATQRCHTTATQQLHIDPHSAPAPPALTEAEAVEEYPHLLHAAERLYLDATGERALPEGHPGCAFLLACPGDEIEAAEARALGITPSGRARQRP